MKRIVPLLLLLLASACPAAAEPGHQFAPVKPEESAKIQTALPSATVKAARPRRLLVFFLTEGFVHNSIPYCNEAIRQMAQKTGAFTADFSDDMGVFTAEKLQPYDAILFNSTTGLKFTDPAAREALVNFAKAGKGIIGVHAATDNFPSWEQGRVLLGGAFDGHPWGSGDLVAVKVDDPASPIMAPFGGKGFWLYDEIYQMKVPYDRSQVHELLSLDMSKAENARAPEKIHRPDNDFPIAWIKQVDGGGRVFYSSLGHNPSIFWTPPILQMYLDGIQFALGDLTADATPTARLATSPAAALAPARADSLNDKPSSGRPAAAVAEKQAASSPSPAPVAAVAATTPPAAALASGDPFADGVAALAAYDYGADRNGIVAFDTFIRSHPGERPRVEAALLGLLSKDDASIGAKDYICRWLGVIGSDASIPALRQLIGNARLSHLAVYALLSLHTPAAGATLLDSVGSAPAALRPAILGAIGRARLSDAIPVLAKCTTSGDVAEATAALDALGDIGSAAALETLRTAAVPATLEVPRQWALLHAAQDLAKTGAAGRDAALPTLLALSKSAHEMALHNAAVRDLIETDPANAGSVLLPLLKDGDAGVRAGAVRWISLLPPAGLKTLADALPSFNPATQVAVINEVAAACSLAGEPVLQAALTAQQPEVRLAAIASYGVANPPEVVSVLLPLLAKGGDEGAAALGSLKKVSWRDTAGRLESAMSGASDPVRAALLTILAARQERSAFDLFVTSTGDPDPAVATAAFQGIEAVANKDDLDRLANLLPRAKTNAQHKSLNAALFRCARTAVDKDKAADFLIATLQNAPADSRVALLAAIASVHSAKATASLRSQLTAPVVDTRKEVIRALSTAHTPEADKLLLDAASQGTEPSEKILALRSYLDSIQAETLSTPQRLEAYKTAWVLAIRPEEKQAILDALKHLPGSDAKKAFGELSAQPL